MRMIYVTASDVRAALRLKELIGRQRVARFRPDQHPLGLSFVALQKQVIGLVGLTPDEARALGRLNLLAEAVFAHPDWQAYADRLAADLSDAHECLSIEFELEVIDFALAKARRVSWIRYEHGAPDIRCFDPDLHVECKLLRVEELTRDTLFDAIAAGGRQHRDAHDVPIVVAVGFDKILSPEAREFLNAEYQNRGVWFSQRPEVAAALVFLPKEIDEVVDQALGVPRLWLKRGEVNEIVNHRASMPLPVGFSSVELR